MQNLIPKKWREILSNEFNKPYFILLNQFINDEYDKKVCFPPKNQIFNAFELTNPEDIKVVIIGQDPYHNDLQAHGLAFSVNHGIKFPPSLSNIFRELSNDSGLMFPISGNLTQWANQGVFLLNATLTVEAHAAASHQKKGWEIFTDEVIRQINKRNSSVVFMLWGGFAKKKSKLIDAEKHLILTANHPSPLSANRGGWFGSKHFSKANSYLMSKNITPINW